jgi:hypothetical protein
MIIDRPSDFEGMVPQNRIAFKFAANAMMVDILSNLIYKDKVLAVIRELSCNAYDAHIQAGNPKPFKVQVPTKLDPVFAVEDTGCGLSADKIGDIFWTYGSSTKTKTNDQIGAMGIGSKSPFAYTKSSFVVRSRFEGVETHYLCFINEEGTPDGAVTLTQDTDQPNGVRVEMGVRAEDIGAFHQRIVNFFKYWKVKPELIHGDDINWLPMKPILEGTGWHMEHNSTAGHQKQAKAVMGNVAYPISYSAIPNPSTAMTFVANNHFVIDFKLGDLAFAASREELSYDERTVQALEAGAQRVMKEFYTKLAKEAEVIEATPIDTVTRFQTYLRVVGRVYGHDVVNRSNMKNIVLKQGALELKYADLCQREGTVKFAGHSSLMLYNLNTARSSSNIRLAPAVEVILGKDETITDLATKAVTVKHRERTVAWFSPLTKAKKTLKGMAVSDFLADGWKAETSKFQLTLPVYDELSEHQKDVGRRLQFVLNDAGPRGSVGVRAYYQSYNRNDERLRTIFVDYDQKTAPADFGVAELQAIIKDTVYEGASFHKLTQLPGFVMPKAEPKADRPTVATAPRGWFEVRRVIFRATGEQAAARIANARGRFAMLAESPSESEYVKLDPSTLTTYYTLSAPGGMDKNLRTTLMSADFAFAFHAGAFDATEAVVKDAKGERQGIRFIVRNQDDVDALIKKGAVLKNVQELVDMIPKIDVSSVAAYLDLSEAIGDYNTTAYNLTNNNGVLSREVRKHLKNLPATSPIAEMIKMLNELESFFSKDQTRVALGALAPATGGAASKKMFHDLLKRYPLIGALSNRLGTSKDTYESLEAYILMEDARIAEKEAAAAAVAAAKAAAAAQQAVVAAVQTPVLATV